MVSGPQFEKRCSSPICCLIVIFLILSFLDSLEGLLRASISVARGRLKKNWMEGIKKAMNERNLNEGQWEDRKQWSLGVGQRRKTF